MRRVERQTQIQNLASDNVSICVLLTHSLVHIAGDLIQQSWLLGFFDYIRLHTLI